MPSLVRDRKFKNPRRPDRLAHVVLRTGQFDKMVKFYQDFFNADIVFNGKLLLLFSKYCTHYA